MPSYPSGCPVIALEVGSSTILISSEFGAESRIRVPPKLAKEFPRRIPSELAKDNNGVYDDRDDDGDIHDVGDGDDGDE